MAEINYTAPLIIQRADPYIYRHTDGYYYFTASVPSPCRPTDDLAQA